MIEWTKKEELDAFLGSRGTGFILKHSTRCSISAEALKEFEAFERAEPAAPSIFVLVIESRPVSDAISKKLEIPHASPQAILVRDGTATWQASHWEITRKTLESAWKVGTC